MSACPTDLIRWINAALDADKKIALAALPHPLDDAHLAVEKRAHWVQHNPQAVLRRIAADRSIVADLAYAIECWAIRDATEVAVVSDRRAHASRSIRLMAAGMGHPDALDWDPEFAVGHTYTIPVNQVH